MCVCVEEEENKRKKKRKNVWMEKNEEIRKNKI